MEAHIKGHANEVPDDEDGNDSNISSGGVDSSTTTTTTSSQITHGSLPITSVSTAVTSVLAAAAPSKASMQMQILPETPRESSSEATSDGDDLTYYNMYSRYGQNISSYSTNNQQGVNPALLAAVSLAASASGMDDLRPSTSANHHLPQHQQQQQQQQQLILQSHSPLRISSPPIQQQQSLVYQPLSVMRPQSYFTPVVPKVEEFR